jgi:metal-dependent amidase/aminoacylase/carboxypeptidase family protein
MEAIASEWSAREKAIDDAVDGERAALAKLSSDIHANPELRFAEHKAATWIVELLLKYLVGVQTLDGDRLVVEPFDFGLRHFSVERLRWRGHDVAITWRARKTDAAPKGLTVSVDGKRRAHADTLTRLEIAL